MSQKLQPVRGTHDVLPEDARKRRFITETARDVGTLYGFEEMATPIFEFSEVFHRTLGEASDIVSKETYTFEDRGGERLTLRPEFTAGVVRAFLSNGLQQQLPCKFFSAGPLFRYERPQKGRMRQFHQINFEAIGPEGPLADIELLAMADQILSALGLKNKVNLELNSLGDSESRAAYREALVAYFSRYKNDLSDDSKVRLEKNPLRILDSKDKRDRELVADAPALADHYSDAARAFFDGVKEGLEAIDLPYTVNPRLVRGLDYYSHVVFEFTTDLLGAQNAVLSGGRYDGLLPLMGGPELPATGFAAGIERLAELSEKTLDFPKPVVILPMDPGLTHWALGISQVLRHNGVAVEVLTGGNLGKRLKRADKMASPLALILGEEERKAGRVTLKHLATGDQRQVPEPALVETVKEVLGVR